MAGKKAFGTKFSYSIDGGANFVDFANVTKVKPYNAKAGMVDVTSMDSPGGWAEKLATILDAGEATLDINLDDKNATHRWPLTNLGVSATFKLTGPGAAPATATFAGFVKAVSPDFQFDKALAGSIGIEISGPITVT